MTDDYEYKERQVELDRDREFRLGEGKISGYSSIFLAVLSFLAVLAYQFPSYLTTTELRQAYDAGYLQNILKYGMYFSLFFGALTFYLKKYRLMGGIGITITLVAFLIGGYSVPVGQVEARELSLGVDWMILAFLGSAAIFLTLEKLFHRSAH